MKTKRLFTIVTTTSIAVISAVFITHGPVGAQVENPQSGGIGLQGQISAPPPKTAPTISFPTNGQVVTSIPVEVRGICSGSYLIKLFKNNVFSGSDACVNGNFSITIDLFTGTNDLVARYVDDLGQQGPDSNKVSVNYNDGSGQVAIAERVLMTSVYAKRGANPGDSIIWPIVISGGTAPYAISVDWGDGTIADVYSVSTPGEFKIKHSFEQAGVYRALIKATDKNSNIGFLQVVAIGNGEIDEAQVAGAIESQPTRTITRILWEPFVVAFFLIISTFYLGKKYELTKIKHRLSRGEHPFD